MATREAHSFCRICLGHCGTVLTLDEQERVVGVRGDHEDSQTLGYACFKGLQSAEAHNSPDRLLHPLKRMADGSFQKIGLEQALDEIAARLDAIRQASGPEAIAGFKGNGAYFNAAVTFLVRDFLRSLGSPKAFSTNTIDQSAKSVAVGRMGHWPAGKDPLHKGDVYLLIASNPLVSVNLPFDTRNPMKRLKEAKARGMKFIVIDPRHTETAHFADVFLQPLPGEDAAIAAGLLHIVLKEGWHDAEFCAAHVGDLESLRRAVAPFTPELVAARAQVPAEKLIEVADVFARQCRRGVAATCTGTDMAPHSNLAEHLVEALNVVCGRYIRAGEPIENPGVLSARYPRRAQAVPARRPWEKGYKSRIEGFGLIDGELPTGILVDEILTPGEGQVKALLVVGGNPASSIPNQRRVVDALRSLDLLVTVEPFMSATAMLSHYILPPTMQYERADLPFLTFERILYPQDAFTRYTPAHAKPPAGSEVTDDWYVLWALAKRLGVALQFQGKPLDMEQRPTTDDLLAILARHAPVPFAEIQQQKRGGVFGEAYPALPPEEGWQGKFTVAPDDVVAELADLAVEVPPPAAFTHRLATRRHRDVFNSAWRHLPAIRERLPYNRAFIHPDDLASHGIKSGERVEIISAVGSIVAESEADETVRPGVVSIAHGFGLLPDGDYAQEGVSTNLLLSGTDRQSINAMPQMSAIPISIRRAEWPRNV
jgi:anaerobic selenocysteine-containing dehydrogenase